MTRTTKTLAALVLAAAALTLVACTSGGALEGTAWRLTGWSVSSVDPAQVTITASFADGQVTGSGGVNSYGGPYATGPGDAFHAGPIASTLMAGPEPAQRAETAFFELLGKAASYELTGDALTLRDAGGNESLIFTATK